MAGSDAADGDLTTLIVPATPTLIESVAPTIGPDAPLTPPEQMPPSPLYRAIKFNDTLIMDISDALLYGVKADDFEEKLYMVCAHDCCFFEMCEYVEGPDTLSIRLICPDTGGPSYQALYQADMEAQG